MHKLLLKEILLLIKKHLLLMILKHLTIQQLTATNNANNHAFGEKSWFLRIMHHLLIVLQRLMA